MDGMTKNFVFPPSPSKEHCNRQHKWDHKRKEKKQPFRDTGLGN